MKQNPLTCLLITGLLCLLAAPASGQTGRRAVEQGLLPAVLIEGRDTVRYDVHERMKRYDVAGVGVAVINDGRVEWAAGYGVKRAGGTDAVDASTRFQAASISKPVAAAGALRLVEEGRLGLDQDVNDVLRSWRVPENGFDEPVTLRRLLSHTAGTTVHGFPGYAKGEYIPSTLEVLDGKGNTDAVVVDTLPGSIWRYSGGGYTIAQLLVSEVAEKSFADYMRAAVLEPLGMQESTYEQPLPDHFADDAAEAHGWDGAPIAGGWHTYPEQAAAGLWTTPTDLAHFALEIARAFNGESSTFLSQETAAAMLTPEVDDHYGLGFGITDEGEELRFSHGGSNAGYRCFLAMYPKTGDGIVVMTNANGGADLSAELHRAVSDAYGWPHNKPEVRAVASVDPALLEKYAGEYEVRPGARYTLRAEGGKLLVDGPGRHPRELYPESATEFFGAEIPMQVRFNVDADDVVTSLSILRGDDEMRAEKIR